MIIAGLEHFQLGITMKIAELLRFTISAMNDLTVVITDRNAMLLLISVLLLSGTILSLIAYDWYRSTKNE